MKCSKQLEKALNSALGVLYSKNYGINCATKDESNNNQIKYLVTKWSQHLCPPTK